MAIAKLKYDAFSDLQLAGLMAARDPGAVRLGTRRNNQRLFRAAWVILKNRAEAEDAVQRDYLHGLVAIGDFGGRSSLSTWLTHIVVNEALDLVSETVKTRLLRARRRLQQDLAPEVRATPSGTFPFAGADCEALTRRVMDSMCGSA